MKVYPTTPDHISHRNTWCWLIWQLLHILLYILNLQGTYIYNTAKLQMLMQVDAIDMINDLEMIAVLKIAHLFI